jgi:hypothetical protein
MTTYRKAIARSVIGLLIIGATLTVVPFCSSLQPSARAGASLPRLNVASLQPGSFQIRPMSKDFVFLLLKDYDSSLHLFWLPRNYAGRVLLPDRNPWSGPECNNFGPDLTNGRMAPDGMLRCQDIGADDWRTSYRWTYSGHRLGAGQSDLTSVRFKIEGSDIVPWMPESRNGA